MAICLDCKANYHWAEAICPYCDAKRRDEIATLRARVAEFEGDKVERKGLLQTYAGLLEASVAGESAALEEVAQQLNVVKRLVIGCIGGCTRGWVHHQAPMKGSGVIGHSEPCQTCNADELIPLPSAFIEIHVFVSGREKEGPK